MITDYASLRTAIANWLARADLSAAIPEFIQLAEANMNRDLNARQRQVEVADTSSGGVIPIPADLYGIQSLRVARGGGFFRIGAVTPDQQYDMPSVPVAYTVVNEEIRLIGTADTDYKLIYRRQIPALGESAPQNWLILREPGLYLYGALVEASPYLKDDERTLVWATQYRRILDACNAQYDLERFGPSSTQKVDFRAP